MKKSKGIDSQLNNFLQEFDQFEEQIDMNKQVTKVATVRPGTSTKQGKITKEYDTYMKDFQAVISKKLQEQQ